MPGLGSLLEGRGGALALGRRPKPCDGRWLPCGSGWSSRSSRIAKLVYPVGFYNTKARHLVAICRELSNRWEGRVPEEMDELLTLPGVGRKTANLVLTQGFGKPGICVDTHVHRIANRLGYVRTKTPKETEFALREKLPPEHWIVINDLLVAFGQHCCTPVSPHCSTCPVSAHCWRVGVGRSR